MFWCGLFKLTELTVGSAIFYSVYTVYMCSTGKKKPYTSPDGSAIEEDRHVSAQPLKFQDNKFNFRVLNNLPHHRLKAGQLDLLKDECLTNVEFVLTKLQALSVE